MALQDSILFLKKIAVGIVIFTVPAIIMIGGLFLLVRLAN